MIFRQAKSNVLRQLLVLSSCFTTVMSMAYLGLDMRTPKKCVSVDYAGAKIDLAYEIFDPNKERLTAGVRMPGMPDSMQQSKVELEAFPPDGSRIRRTKANHITKSIEDLEGVMSYQTPGQGVIHVCVSIAELPNRKYPRPTLIGLKVSENKQIVEEQAAEIEKGQKEAKRHLSEMEHILMTMTRETKVLMKNADSIQADEAIFHKKSVEMNAASRWWPMMHVVVLLVTGFTQANHVIKFFKGMHII